MVEFQRLSIYLVDIDSDLAICAYRTGQGVGRRFGESAKLSESGMAEIAANGETRLFPDLSEYQGTVVWNQAAPSGMRSGMMAPAAHHGVTVGLVFLEHRLPRAYGIIERTCLEEIVEGISPSLAHLVSQNRIAAGPVPQILVRVQQKMSEIFGSSQLLEDVFPSFVATLDELVPIDQAGISWIDPNGYDLRDLWASPGHGILEAGLTCPAGPALDIRLRIKEQTIGVLTVSSKHKEGFSVQDRSILDRIGIQMAPAVQAGRLYVHARRQAYQLTQLNRVKTTPPQAGSLTSFATALADQIAGIGQADWSAVIINDQRDSGQWNAADSMIHCEELPEDLMEEVGEVAARCFDQGAPVRCLLHGKARNASDETESSHGVFQPWAQEDSWNCLALPLGNSVEKTGVLVLGRNERLPWTSEEVRMLEEFVRETANELESARRRDAAQRADSGNTEGFLGPIHHVLSTDISDSLRGPIASITDFGKEMLHERIEWTQEDCREFLRVIDRESQRLDRIVSDLLSPTPGEMGVIVLRKELRGINELFQEAGSRFGLAKGGPPVVFDFEPTLPPVWVDPAAMARVIRYLATEAGDTFPGNLSINVGARWRQGRPSVSVGVAHGEDTKADPKPHRQGDSLRLEVCRTLLSAHGEQLETLDRVRSHDLFRFFLTPAAG